jgi:predicted nucleotidyltransferase
MYKGRPRIRRGKLQKFEDLPLCKQSKFKIIANKVKELDDSVTEVFVYGSYFWGNWDEESDYDVRINQSFKGSYADLKDDLLKENELKVDLMALQKPKIEMNLVVIPFE